MNIDEKIKQAMLNKDAKALSVLRALKTALTSAETKGKTKVELTELEVIGIVRSEIKKRQDAIDAYTKAGQKEKSMVEEGERDYLETFLPAALTKEEVDAIIRQALAETGASSKKEAGKAIKRAAELAQGRIENKLLSEKILANLP